MIKDIEKNNENVAINDKEIAVLKEHFSACFKKDGSFDLERFKEELKDKVDIVHEGYELKFLGKSYAKLLASMDTTTVIIPNTKHNNLPENANSENIYISGDNLDGLKHLLKSYSKSVKCIYIDPPYNTGSDGFVYKDNFNFTAEELQDKLSIDETQAKRIIDLTKRNSSSHSAWLMFMYSRLQLAKDLLKDDGVIFISLDNNEQSNLKLLCDDVFGEENFLAQFIWRNGRTSSSVYTNEHEYIISYARKIEKVNLIKYEGEEELISDRAIKKVGVKNPASEIRFKKGIRFEGEDKVFDLKFGDSETIEVTYGVLECRDNLLANDVTLKAGWVMKDMIEDWLAGKDVIDSKGQKVTDFFFKPNGVLQYVKERGTIHPKTIIEGISTKRGSKEVLDLLGIDVFDYPKPVPLIDYILQITDKDSVVIDFFSGTATTAQAVLQLNARDKGNRKFINIQLPEILDFNNPSQKNAFNFLKSLNHPTTLDYIGYERIKRAAKKIKEETKAKIDYGFKHFILNEPNQNTLDKCDTFDKAGLLGDATILDDFGTETVLTTWLNNDGYGFNAKVQTIDLNGYEAYYCNKHLYLINPDFNQEAMIALFDKYNSVSSFNPENIVLFGYSFIEWSITEMLEKNLKILNDSEKNLKINIDVRY
jgi:adenine-specific DNA-methyltransferase